MECSPSEWDHNTSDPVIEKEGEPVKASGSSGDMPAPPTLKELSKVQEEGSGAMSEGSRKQKVHSY